MEQPLQPIQSPQPPHPLQHSQQQQLPVQPPQQPPQLPVKAPQQPSQPSQPPQPPAQTPQQTPNQTVAAEDPSTNSPLLNFPALPPPPELLYRTETEAVQAVKAWAQHHQYAVITKRTNKGREGKVEAIYMTCDQGQIYRSTAKERQRTPSRRNGCPFNMRISYHKIDRLWHIKIRNGTHNHGPSLPGSHPSVRREEITAKTQYIKALLDINMPPSQIMKQLRHVDPTTVIQVRDIYNLRHRLYQGKSPIPAVMISDFKPATIKKRRRLASPDDSSEASTSGAVEAGALPVTDGPMAHGSPGQDALFDTALF